MPSATPPAATSRTLCVMPWMNLSTETNGNCKICCVVMTDRYITDAEGAPFGIQRNPIGEIWNSDYLRDVRRRMLAGESVVDCTYCEQQEAAATASPRQYYNEIYLNNSRRAAIARSADNEGRVDSMPTSLEPRPGTLCNLRCGTCWPMSSSKVEAERKALLQSTTVELPADLRAQFTNEIAMAERSDFRWSENSVYLANLEETIPTLERLYFTGGEPVLIKSNIRFLETLVARGKRDLLVAFTTNLTRIDEHLVKLLGSFERVEITGSIDGYGRANDYLRNPSRWEDVSANLARLNALSPSIGVGVMTVVQALNIFSVIRLFRWIGGVPGHRVLEIIPTILQHHEFMRLSVLPETLRARARREIDELVATGSLSERNRTRILEIRSHLDFAHPEAASLRARLLAFQNVLDQHRGLKMADYLPEISESISRGEW